MTFSTILRVDDIPADWRIQIVVWKDGVFMIYYTALDGFQHAVTLNKKNQKVLDSYLLTKELNSKHEDMTKYNALIPPKYLIPILEAQSI